ncbi:MAG: peptide chain release factor N(5)-glutamine methyltransferase [Bacillota bacterium]
MKVKDLLDYCYNELQDITRNFQNESEILIENFTKLKKIDLIINRSLEIDESTVKKIKQKIKQRKNNVPLQYIIGNQEFMGLKFEVNEHTLIPRQDTEILVEKLVEIFKDKECEILEIGSGSGAISVSLAKMIKDASVTSVDISKKALEVSKKNAKLNNVFKKIDFIESDIFEKVDKKFDLIVSNPPYIKSKEIEKLQKEVSIYEPKLALDGGKDGLDFYRNITKNAYKFLKQDGILAFEIGDNQVEDVKKIMNDSFEKITVYKDLQKIDRAIIGRLKR